MKLKLVQKGTHILPVSEWNNDRPSPAEVVADELQAFEHAIGKLVKVGGAINNDAAYLAARQTLMGLNLALNAASEQGWKFELEEIA